MPAGVPAVPKAAFELHPTLGFSEEYTDNFQLTTQNKQQNFRSTLAPGLSLLINGPRTQGTVSSSLGLAQDSVNSLGDLSVFGSISASVTHTFDPRLSLTLTDTFTRSDAPSLADQFGLRKERQTFTSNTLGLSADWFVGPVVAQGYYQLSTFFSGANTVSQILGADAGLPLGPLMAIKGGYEFSHTQTSGDTKTSGGIQGSNKSTGNLLWVSLARRLGSSMSAGVSSSYSLQSLGNTRIWNASLFTTSELAGRLSLSGSVGYSFLRSDSGGDFSMVSSRTSVSYRFAKAVVAVTLNQDLQPTALQGENFGTVASHSYTGTFGYALTPVIDAALRASYNDNQPVGADSNSDSANTKTISAGAGLAWRVSRWLTMGLDYTYTWYSSGTTGSAGGSSGGATENGAVTENRAVLRLTGSF